MSASASTTKPVNRPGNQLPVVAFFSDDEECRGLLVGAQRFRRIPYENLNGSAVDTERVVLVSREQQVAAHYDDLRGPRVRVIAVATGKFKDSRSDGLVYAYVPPQTPNSLLERLVDNALDHIHLVHTRTEVNTRLQGATREISELNQIGAALSAEHDTEKLLEMILTKSRQITQSDAGSLYLVEEIEETAAEARGDGRGQEHNDESGEPRGEQRGEQVSGAVLLQAPGEKGAPKIISERRVPNLKRLRFKLAQNDSVAVPFRESTMEISEKSIAGHVALTGGIVNLEDAYHLPKDVPYRINRSFDEDSGYRTKSILAVPMRNQKGEIVGVLQLINAKRDIAAQLTNLTAVKEHVVSFSERQQQIVESLASQAAVALENSRLYEAIQRLFEGFVRASVIAIEARDPTTSGHSFRVANLTVALAEAVDRMDSGSFAHVRFTRTEMKEIRYASLLHDFGKVGVREEVLVKAKKLYPAQLELIRQRFHFVKQSLRTQLLQSKLDYVLDKGREEYLKRQPIFDRQLVEHLQELDTYFETILRSNEPSLLAEGNFEKLVDISAHSYHDFDGDEKGLLTGDEVRLLSIRKGSLDELEREQIESHVVHTFKFLQQIPWTSEIRNVPEIARGHHEKLNGTGYPFNLSAPEIPIQTRMMTISDIFDALSAADRPYKKAVSLDRALEILRFSVQDGEIDPALFDLFVEARVFDRWKVEPYAY